MVTLKKKNENKYLVLDDVNERKEVSKKEIETINDDEKIEYEKDYMKIRFKSNDDLPLNKPIKLRLLTIIIRSVFSEDDKFYPQLFLDDALYDV